ncbi:flagellar motor switch protein FliM [Desulfuribacillus alkaliarsenatis]|uniref:Flagellar motor switch protein FliM n=1 Tax=Desulfuribacillus alkaliarsenatis TaxID=766136 RepID=A0A1E5G616_9FIRM|nr:flagellar motor switch protein FliM [Desulfuribacillus alkaliarsenatis]OEF98616.1 flagellar motor switch protein FliM [Desulfuribacillus alkaliarsenatis]
MSEVLSQSEIDALLTAISSGELDAEEMRKDEVQKKVKTYDFKRAYRFSKDQTRSLTRIHENFARLLTSYFSAQFRTLVQIAVASVDQLPYDEFIRSIPKMTILNVFEAYPLEGRLVMEVNPNVAYAMLDRLMGGQGVSAEKFRSLTEIETIVMEKIFNKALENFAEAWKTVVDLEPELDVLETNPQFMQIVSPNETVAVISFSTKIGDATGMINLCLPHVVLEPIMPKLTASHWLASQKKARSEQEIQQIQERVKKATVTVKAELGSTPLTIGEFLNLAVGDIIQLDSLYEEPVKIRVGNLLKFKGQPGVSKKRIALQVSEVLEEGVEENG